MGSSVGLRIAHVLSRLLRLLSIEPIQCAQASYPWRYFPEIIWMQTRQIFCKFSPDRRDALAHYPEDRTALLSLQLPLLASCGVSVPPYELAPMKTASLPRASD